MWFNALELLYVVRTMIVVKEAPAKLIDVSNSIMINPSLLSNNTLTYNNPDRQTWKRSSRLLQGNMIRT